MSNIDDSAEGDADCLNEPLEPQAAQRRIRHILTAGVVTFSRHALDELKADALTTVDCTNVLRGGVMEQPEFENGSWRYRARTNRIVVVVAFRSSNEVVVVTAWRMKR